MKFAYVLFGIVVLLGATAAAKDAPIVTPVDPGEIPFGLQGGQQTGIVGNLNSPYYRLTGWFTGAEEYKYLFCPAEQLNCPYGFLLENVHMVLDFTEDMIFPITFTVWIDLEDALWDPARGCWVPGIEDCRSDTHTVTIDEPGMYDISLPIDCACAYLFDPPGAPYWYLLSMHFPELFTANLITDNLPTNCTSWNDWGSGWFDLVGEGGFPGNILMWGDVVCCDVPVGNERMNWDEIKSLFR